MINHNIKNHETRQSSIPYLSYVYALSARKKQIWFLNCNLKTYSRRIPSASVGFDTEYPSSGRLANGTLSLLTSTKQSACQQITAVLLILCLSLNNYTDQDQMLQTITNYEQSTPYMDNGNCIFKNSIAQSICLVTVPGNGLHWLLICK